MTVRPLILLLAAVCLYSSALFASTYKWVDADGQTHYSQSPPPGDIEAKTIKPPPKIDPSHAAGQLENRQKLLQEVSDNREKAAEEKIKTEQELAQKKQQCEKARARLASYQRPRVNLLDADGNPIRATEEQRQAELAKSRDLVEKACSG